MTELVISYYTTAGVAVITAPASFDVYTAPEVRDLTIRLQREASARSIVIDLAAVTYLDSTALCVILAAQRRLYGAGGWLAVAAASEPVTPRAPHHRTHPVRAHPRNRRGRDHRGPVMSRPSAQALAAARDLLSAVTDWIAAREGSNQPDPATIDAAVGILAAQPDRRDVSVSVHPAIVWRICGHLVAIYHFGSHGGPVATAECSCPSKGLCEHLLVALTGTEECRCSGAESGL